MGFGCGVSSALRLGLWVLAIFFFGPTPALPSDLPCPCPAPPPFLAGLIGWGFGRGSVLMIRLVFGGSIP